MSISNDVEMQAQPSMAGAAPQRVQICFDKVSIDVKSRDTSAKRILDDVSGTFGPAAMTAIMGPSGSGKTTMLNALMGKMKPSSGSITVNGKPFNANAMKKITALVPQDDLLTPVLTCSEALMEAAALKTAYTRSERQAHVDDLLAKLGLVECKDVIIGHPEGQKGLSGGQKKRLSVALELTGNPSLLYLDEPTSGLDSVSALSLVKILSSLAKNDATIIATIHQPSAAAFFIFDELLLLAKGKSCYRGPVSAREPLAFFESAGFTCPEFHNPADFAMEVLVGASAQATLQHQLAVKPQPVKDTTLREITVAQMAYPTSFGVQFGTLLQRNIRVMAREPGIARARVGSSIVMGAVMGGLYWQLPLGGEGTNAAFCDCIADRIALMLFTLIFMMLAAVLPTIISVLPELAVMKKEYLNNWYGLRPYYMAKFVADMPLLIVPPLLYMIIMIPMSHLVDFAAPLFFRLYLAALMVTVVAHSFATIISCAAPSLAVAIFCVPISILPMLLFAGFFKNVLETPWVFRWIAYISPFRFGWEAMSVAVFEPLQFDLPSPTPGVDVTGEMVLAGRLSLESPTGSFNDLYWIDIGSMLVYSLVLRVFAFLVLSRRVGGS